MNKGYFIHPSAIIDDGAVIGNGSKIWHFCHVMRGAIVGQNCSLGQNVFVASSVKLGNNVRVQNNVSIYDGVYCKEDVFLGPSCVFTNVINPRAAIEKKCEYKKTLIEKGASVGANATIVCGVILGKYCLVGAGAVVTKDVPDYAVVVGNPAYIINYVCECGENLNFKENKALCRKCSKSYFNNGNSVCITTAKNT